ncbi:hypothetical protein B0H13DRAFT_1872683 [Mycena leptocephala]|nr:hypothetical protein B0H13DRAFT_1872683 [Mycena leptocephala]
MCCVARDTAAGVLRIPFQMQKEEDDPVLFASREGERECMVDFAASTLGDKRFRACPMILSQEYSPLPVCWRIFIIRGHHHKAWIINKDIHLSVPQARRATEKDECAQRLAWLQEVHEGREILAKPHRQMGELRERGEDDPAPEGHGASPSGHPAPRTVPGAGRAVPLHGRRIRGRSGAVSAMNRQNASGTWVHPARRVWDIEVFDVRTRKDDSVSVRYGESCGHYIAHAAPEQGIRFRASDMCENPHVTSRDPIDGGRVNDKCMIQQRLRPERDYETGIANPSSPDACQLAAHAGHQIWAKSLDANNAAFFMPPHQVATAVAQLKIRSVAIHRASDTESILVLSFAPSSKTRVASAIRSRLVLGLCKILDFRDSASTNADWIHPFQSLSTGCILRALNSEFQRSLAGNPSLILEATWKPQLDLEIPMQPHMSSQCVYDLRSDLADLSDFKHQRQAMEDEVFTHVRDVDTSGSYDSYGVYLCPRNRSIGKQSNILSSPPMARRFRNAACFPDPVRFVLHADAHLPVFPLWCVLHAALGDLLPHISVMAN